jgi:hypothetical protein
MFHSYYVLHNKETQDDNGNEAQQFIVTLGSPEDVAEVQFQLESLLEAGLD